MTTSDGGGLILDSAQDTFEGTMPFHDQVTPPVPGLVQWAYSLVVQSLEGEAPFTVTLLDARGEQVAADQSLEGVASIEGELRQQTYDLHIVGEKPTTFRAIRSQTYGYRQ
jgi:hypothetical protein